MNKDMIDYLNSTRSSYKIANDQIIETFRDSMIKEYDIEIIIIWSSDANIEIVRFEGKKYIVWDTHFWNYFSFYYQYRRILYSKWEEKKDLELLLIQADCIWADLLRISIQRIKNIDSKYALFLSKYYLQYGRTNFGRLDSTEEDLGILYFSKIFILFHEVAHTQTEDHELFKNTFGQIVKQSILDNEPLLRDRLASIKLPDKKIEYIIKELKSLEHDVINEFLTDIFALAGLTSLRKEEDSIDSIQKNVRNAYAILSSFRYNLNIIYNNILINSPLISKKRTVKERILGKIEDLEIKIVIEKDFDFYMFSIQDSNLYVDENRINYFNRLIMPDKQVGEILRNRILDHLNSMLISAVKNYDSIEESSVNNFLSIVNFNLTYEGDESEYDGGTLYHTKDL